MGVRGVVRSRAHTASIIPRLHSLLPNGHPGPAHSPPLNLLPLCPSPAGAGVLGLSFRLCNLGPRHCQED